MPCRSSVLTILVMTVLLLSTPNLVVAQDSTPPAPGASILDAYGVAWSSGDAAAVGALYTENAVRDDVPTGITSHGRAEIEALAAGLFKTDDDVRLDVTDGFAGESWAVVEWTFSGVRPGTGYELTFRGASVLELENGLIDRESNYYDLPELQSQIAAAGGTPAAMTEATPGAAATSEQPGAVTVRVYACPVALAEDDDDLAALEEACAPLADDWAVPTLTDLEAGSPAAGAVTAPGVYDWAGLTLGSYAIGGSGEQPADLGGLLVLDASGLALQNPVVRLNEATPHAEISYFWFLPPGTPAP